MPLGTWPSTESYYRMNTFIEIVFVDPITKAQRKRTISTDGVSGIDADASGMAIVILTGAAMFPAGQGGTRLSTYEAYGDVVARLAQATPGNPTVVVSASDQQKATANYQAAQAQNASSS